MRRIPRLPLLLGLVFLLACDSPGWDDQRPDDDTTAADDDTIGDDDTAPDDDSGDDDIGDDDTGDDDAGDDDTGDDDVGDDDSGDDDDTTPLPGDGDLDGYVAAGQGGDDCDDADPAVHPGATEDPGNGKDDDCDGALDEQIQIAAITPDDGLAGGGTIVIVSGNAFTGVAQAMVGGVAAAGLSVLDDGAIEIVTPPGTVGDVDVSVSHALGSGTLAGGFRYTGLATGIDEATIPSGVEQYGQPGVPSASFLGTVTEPGVTDAGGQGAGIEAEAGLAGQGFDPTAPPDSWTWFPASFDADDGDGDRYVATVTPPTYGTWMVTFRFSDDGGYNWKYADSDAATPLDVTEMSMLHVAP